MALGASAIYQPKQQEIINVLEKKKKNLVNFIPPSPLISPHFSYDLHHIGVVFKRVVGFRARRQAPSSPLRLLQALGACTG